jgi:hypothetical protein
MQFMNKPVLVVSKGEAGVEKVLGNVY